MKTTPEQKKNDDKFTKKNKKLMSTIESEKDIIKTLNLIEDMNQRLYELELKRNDQIKMNNLTTNSMNYILAALYVYEEYFEELGIPSEDIQAAIDYAFYKSINKKNKNSEYSSNIIKKVNEKLREFKFKVGDKK